jgi:hypothetical protein
LQLQTEATRLDASLARCADTREPWLATGLGTRHAHDTVREILAGDGDPLRNLATFVTVEMDPGA